MLRRTPKLHVLEHNEAAILTARRLRTLSKPAARERLVALRGLRGKPDMHLAYEVTTGPRTLGSPSIVAADFVCA
jgi:hypothetical protein